MERYRIPESSTTIVITSLAFSPHQPLRDHLGPMGESSYLSSIEFETHCNFSYFFDFLSYNTILDFSHEKLY